MILDFFIDDILISLTTLQDFMNLKTKVQM